MIMNDAINHYQYVHNQRQKDIMEWLRYEMNSGYLEYHISIALKYNPDVIKEYARA